MKTPTFDRSTAWGWIALVLLLAIVVVQYSTKRRPFGAARYHEQVRQATELVPDRIEGWVGHDAPQPIMPGNAYAADVAVPMWAGFMKTATAGSKPAWFSPPKNIVSASICKLSGKRPASGCDSVHVSLEDGSTTERSMIMTEYFVRDGDMLTHIVVVIDPVYLAEPLVKSQDFARNPRELPPGNWIWVCEPVVEVAEIELGTVPAYMPGEHPFKNEFGERHGLPEAAVRGGPETMYPEYRKVLEGQYQRPDGCTRYCCGWGGGNTANGGFTDAPGVSCTTREQVRAPSTPAPGAAPAQRPAAPPGQQRR